MDDVNLFVPFLGPGLLCTCTSCYEKRNILIISVNWLENTKAQQAEAQAEPNITPTRHASNRIAVYIQ
jgi:hypothetical protein